MILKYAGVSLTILVVVDAKDAEDLSPATTPEKKLKVSFEADSSNNKSSPASSSRASSFSSLIVDDLDSAGSITISNEDTETEDDDTEGEQQFEDDISLTERMSSVRVSPKHERKKEAKEKKKAGPTVLKAKKKVREQVWEGKFPFMVYTWQDVQDNNLCTVEVHMPSASISSEFHLELETHDDGKSQSLLIKYRVGASFFDEEAFDTFISDFVENIKDASAMSRARHNRIQQLREKFSDDYDITNKYCNMMMQIKLPFLCEDIFNIHDYHGQYKNTGKTFRIFNTEDEDHDIVTAHVLIVSLVSKNRKKPDEILRRNTPRTVKKRGVVARTQI